MIPKKPELLIDEVVENAVDFYIEQKYQAEEEEPDYAEHNEF